MRRVIDEFVKDKKVAIAGASRRPEKFGNALVRILAKKGYTVYPVNPRETEIENLRCYASVRDLPEEVHGVICALPPAAAQQVVWDCAGTGVRRVWLHQGEGSRGAYSREAHEFCLGNHIDVVYGLCPLMFFPPAGIHRLHFLFKKWGKKLPPEYSASGVIS